ncbi:MAG TPA: hypothetical protein VK559_05495 [Ferruginibacter sp.]|nr:hypothetical protein [Ferruginibacter sp.]
MKQYFFFLLLILFISFSSFIMHRNSTVHQPETITDSTPAPAQLDSVWIGSGYGWTHGTYHWIPAHWEAAKNKKKSHPATVVTSVPVKDSTTKDSSTVTKVPAKDSAASADGRVFVKGHRELQHNNYVWVPGHWVAADAPAK